MFSQTNIPQLVIHAFLSHSVSSEVMPDFKRTLMSSREAKVYKKHKLQL